jgi:chromosomal replication initiator protein
MQAWDDFLQKQESLLGKEIVEKWLRPLKIVHFDSGNLYLEAKDSFQVLWFEEHIRPHLKSQLLNNNFRSIKVHLTTGQPQTPPQQRSKYDKKEKGKTYPALVLTPDKVDPSMTLENFIPGESNKIVFRLFCELTGYDIATEKLSDPTVPLATFNPIYLWGGSGSGKTHLLMALTQAFKKRGLNALYAKAETFTEHVVTAIRASEMQAFRKAYRHADILLIDDVHVFSRKDATQEEFFHTFNTLHASGRQIILSSKCAPALLEEIEPRLISRFEWGINVHFEKLNSLELKQVLNKRCAAFNFPLNEEVVAYLLEAFPTSTSLNRALEALILRSHLGGDVRHRRNSLSIDKLFAQNILADLSAQEIKAALTPEKVIAAVSSTYGIRNEDLLGKSQAQECSLPRQIAMHLCRESLKLPYQAIGQIFSRDHSTVMTSIKQIQKKLEEDSDKELLSALREIHTKIEG